MRENAPILVTGVAGFIGHATAHRLLDRGETVVGVDIVNDYYDPALKQARLATFEGREGFAFHRMDVADAEAVAGLVRERGVTRVVHLAAQAGVRYSIANPFAYERSNLAGHLAVMEACRHEPGFVHLVYASSSSVYGDKPMGGQGFREDEPAASPVSLYAATKRACELMSQSYAALYGFPQTGLRFFTVYGPWGRPDMAYFSFTDRIMAGQPIEVYGEGRMARDFTYIDDIVDGIVGALDRPPETGGHRILNIGGSHPVGLMEMIATLEHALDREAVKIMKPMQPGDVTATYADVSRLHALTGYAPRVRLQEGLGRFADWYRGYFRG
ncbi:MULTISPECIES: NAD-dependent epimerase/dehydratase family protein [unclassified Sphingomonas]|uniref:NAD-dependent epimerase/dehydratase family protein n=1 Tax=unclassified Sphingomonas TaxID=196159 RepID=UPI002857AB22|nr:MULTISPECIES: NAD-dependent epimerase/dehydratase family protein [unclassified Sphingomonas]MDR6115772.1 UDP-glucuronate 4-epimerase [Sphingomonas sp. SORGH_AS_0789]MDR6150557.1 UDP-glucuronate 4-epimerase [Sphingomonas sp. SORGH_AS_0742]